MVNGRHLTGPSFGGPSPPGDECGGKLKSAGDKKRGGAVIILPVAVFINFQGAFFDGYYGYSSFASYEIALVGFLDNIRLVRDSARKRAHSSFSFVNTFLPSFRAAVVGAGCYGG